MIFVAHFFMLSKSQSIWKKFEAIFVKQILPWNSTPCKPCSFKIGSETSKNILRGAFSMPMPNSKHTRNWWDNFLLFWLGANSLPRTCDQWNKRNKYLTTVFAFHHFLFYFTTLERNLSRVVKYNKYSTMVCTMGSNEFWSHLMFSQDTLMISLKL